MHKDEEDTRGWCKGRAKGRQYDGVTLTDDEKDTAATEDGKAGGMPRTQQELEKRKRMQQEPNEDK